MCFILGVAVDALLAVAVSGVIHGSPLANVSMTLFSRTTHSPLTYSTYDMEL